MSGLSNRDFIALVANYSDLCNGEKSKVSADLLDRGYTAEQLEAASSQFAKHFNPVTSCGLRFTKPFGHIKYELLGYVLTLFENYERGCLPFPGPASEQPAQIMEIFSVLRQLKLEVEIKTAKTASSQSRSKR